MKSAFKILLTVSAFIIFMTSCSNSDDDATPDLTNEEKAIELLKSIETGSMESLKYINPNKYIQHNLSAPDGIEGFRQLLENRPSDAKVNIVRTFTDDNFVVLHTEYDFFGPLAGFDIFRFENGLAVEYWDNLQPIATETASGRTMFDGPTEIQDLDLTNQNKTLVQNYTKMKAKFRLTVVGVLVKRHQQQFCRFKNAIFKSYWYYIQEVFIDGIYDNMENYVSSEQYFQHNPNLPGGLDVFRGALQNLASAGIPLTFDKNHVVLGQGNFVLAVSEGTFRDVHNAYYDLFRIDNGLIVEHWDVIQPIPDPSEWQNSNGKFGF